MNHTSWPVAAPTAEQWGRIPVRFSIPLTMVPSAVLLVATVAGAFIADRGWESEEEPLFPGVFNVGELVQGGSLYVALVLVFGVWMLARFAVLAVPLALTSVAIVTTTFHVSTPWVWWAGAGLTLVWQVVCVIRSVVQVRSTAQLARDSRTSEVITLKPQLQEKLAKIQRSSINWAFGLAIVAVLLWTAVKLVYGLEEGRTAQEMGDWSWSAILFVPAFAASVLALGQIIQVLWRAISRKWVGNYVWRIPANANGPVLADFAPYSFDEDLAMVQRARAQAMPGCLCWTELERERRRPSSDDEFEDFEELPPPPLIPASDYCVHHGIDAVNHMSREEFQNNIETGWLWSEHSPYPLRVDGTAQEGVLVGFAGHAFTGMIATAKKSGTILGATVNGGSTNAAADVREWDENLAWERDTSDFPMDEEWSYDPPLGGELDRIDLRSLGYKGVAVRYKHERAWFVADR